MENFLNQISYIHQGIFLASLLLFLILILGIITNTKNNEAKELAKLISTILIGSNIIMLSFANESHIFMAKLYEQQKEVNYVTFCLNITTSLAILLIAIQDISKPFTKPAKATIIIAGTIGFLNNLIYLFVTK